MDGNPRDSAVREALDAIRRLVRALRLSARAAERRFGLSGAQLFVLQQLHGARGLSLGELAQRTNTDPSSVSVVVRRLVDRGLVSRRRDPVDFRRVRLGLTAKGRALVRSAPPMAQESLLTTLERLSGSERRSLARLLGKVVAGMGLDRDVAEMLFLDRAPGESPQA